MDVMRDCLLFIITDKSRTVVGGREKVSVL